MAADVTIHRATADDLALLVHLAAAFRDHLGQTAPSDAEFRAAFADLVRDADTEFLLARDAHGAPVGYVQLRFRRSAWTRGLQGEIEDVFVVPAARRCGVGRRLLERTIARAAARGCRTIGLNTNEHNQAALQMYRQFGFGAERRRWNGGRQLWLEKTLPGE
jgi:ribosomal protein S18 acetylase RimI-like enzyme